MKPVLRLAIICFTVFLLMLHAVAVGLFLTPPTHVLALAYPDEAGTISLMSAPAHLREAFSFLKEEGMANVTVPQTSSPFRSMMMALLYVRNEKTKSADAHFELALNTLDFGVGVKGVQAGSLHYFKKLAYELTAEEADTLAELFLAFREFK